MAAGTDGDQGQVIVVLASFCPDPALLARQLHSIASQTHDTFRCLVVDDHSPDAVVALIARLCAFDERFELIPHGRNVGFYANVERGLRYAQGYSPAFIALSDQDDNWYPTKLERSLAALRESGASLCCSDVVVVDSDRRIISSSFFEHRGTSVHNASDLLLMNSAIGATTAFTTDLLDLALPFPAARYRSFHDHWLARCAQASGGVAFIDSPTMEYVQHGRNVQGYTAARHRWRDLATLLREGRKQQRSDVAPPAEYHDDLALVVARLEEAIVLRDRLVSAKRRVPADLERAIALHERWLNANWRSLLSVVASWVIDQRIRARPRHEHIETRYLRAIMQRRHDLRRTHAS